MNIKLQAGLFVFVLSMFAVSSSAFAAHGFGVEFVVRPTPESSHSYCQNDMPGQIEKLNYEITCLKQDRRELERHLEDQYSDCRFPGGTREYGRENMRRIKSKISALNVDITEAMAQLNYLQRKWEQAQFDHRPLARHLVMLPGEWNHNSGRFQEQSVNVVAMNRPDKCEHEISTPEVAPQGAKIDDRADYAVKKREYVNGLKNR